MSPMGKCRLLQRNSRPWTTVRGNCQSYEKTVRSYSCPHWVQLLSISSSLLPGGAFFLLLDLGPGAAACGMGIELNTGYTCYLSAACCRRGRFFSPIGSGPRVSGWWNGDRDKHWVQLLFHSG